MSYHEEALLDLDIKLLGCSQQALLHSVLQLVLDKPNVLIGLVALITLITSREGNKHQN